VHTRITTKWIERAGEGDIYSVLDSGQGDSGDRRISGRKLDRDQMRDAEKRSTSLTYKATVLVLNLRLIEDALACSDVEKCCPDQLTASEAITLGMSESCEHDM
jgi:hypothetical protein